MSVIVNTFLPPYLSVHTPSGMLMQAAKKGGMADKKSVWVAVSPYHLIRNGPRAENIAHMPKPRENAVNDTHKTLDCRSAPRSSRLSSSRSSRSPVRLSFVPDRTPSTPRRATASRTPGTTQPSSNTVKVDNQSFLKAPYFFNATYFLMEIKGLVMYPKG